MKALPPAPPDVGGIEAAWRAVPLVPKPEGDCCARLVERLGLPGRDVAREWLTVLRGLGLVEETTHGFTRVGDADPTRSSLADAFLDGVFGARETVDALESADEPLPPDAVFGIVAATVPAWERARDPEGWFDRWRDRVSRVLEWLVLLGLATRTDRGYARE